MYQHGGAQPPAPPPDARRGEAIGSLPGLDVDMDGLDALDLDMDLSQFDELRVNYPPPLGAGGGLVPAMSAMGSGALAMPGAGPLPTGFGVPTLSMPGSTLTEFTKRRNWSQRLLEELRDFLHILTPDGRVLYASPSCKELTGWAPNQLVGHYLADFIHPEDRPIFLQEFSEAMAAGTALRFFYRFRKIDDTKTDDSWVIFEVHGHPHLSADPGAPFSPHGAPINCRGFFMMARPYPTKNAALLDSFLEHKIENERLMKRIADLKREEQEDLNDEASEWRGDTYSSVAASETIGQTESEAGHASSYNAMPPPARPGVSNTALTQQNLDEALSTSKPDSITDKMERYQPADDLDPIQMLTGLRYLDGERSQGISTGDANPLLIRGDAGIQFSLNQEGRNSTDRKKKAKLADEYVCTDCGTLDSPEWRKGPSGPKTLCNACGLRWAKKEKKKQVEPAGHGQSQTGAAQQPPSGAMNASASTSS